MNLLIIDDDDTLRDLMTRELSRSGHQVTGASTATAGMAMIDQIEPDVVLLDLMLPDMPGIELLRSVRADRPLLQFVVLTAHGTVDTALAAMRLGAFDYLQKPCHLQELELTLERAWEQRRLGEDNARLREGLSGAGQDPELMGCGRHHEGILRFIGKVATSASSVLIRGETGTGKELVARGIHRHSPRREAPFLTVDCAGLNENLLQSELFGHEKGSFTGAVKLKYGLFEVADGGVIFLDEIGDVSPAVQAGLLRVLETGSFRRLGGTREVKVDVRLLAATNRDLERLIRDGRFRLDLFFRLNAIHLELLPLRKRQEEIPLLVNVFVARHNERTGSSKRISPPAMDALCLYRWPGNVRELRHVVERALLFADGELVSHGDLELEVQRARPAQSLDLPATLSLADVEKLHITRVLAKCSGHRANAAQALGIGERSLYRKLRQYQLVEADDERGEPEE